MKLALKANYISLEVSARTGCCNLLIYCHFILAMAYVLPTKRRQLFNFTVQPFSRAFPSLYFIIKFSNSYGNYLIAVIQTAEKTGLKYHYDRFPLFLCYKSYDHRNRKTTKGIPKCSFTSPFTLKMFFKLRAHIHLSSRASWTLDHEADVPAKS